MKIGLKTGVKLAPRERQIAYLASIGRVPKVIADTLEISISSVNGRLQGLCKKIGVHGRAELIVWVLQHPRCLERGVISEPGLHPPGCRCESPYCLVMFRRLGPHPRGCQCNQPACKLLLLAA